MKGYKGDNLSIVMSSVISSENWIRIIERVWITPIFPVTAIAKTSFRKTRGSYKKHSRYVSNDGQGEQYAIC